MEIMFGIKVKPGKCRGVSRISGKGVRLFKNVGFALLVLSHFS